jgi:hypothetical protein
MKLKLIIIFSICITNYLFAQNQNIIGEWKVFSVDNGEFYWNIETDSISMNEDLKLIYNDSLKMIKFREVTKKLYFDMTLNFLDNGKFIQNAPFAKFEFDFKVNKSNDMLFVTSSEVRDKIETKELPFSLKNDILYIEFPWTEPFLKLWLKK